jgi:hypothetical protein
VWELVEYDHDQQLNSSDDGFNRVDAGAGSCSVDRGELVYERLFRDGGIEAASG